MELYMCICTFQSLTYIILNLSNNYGQPTELQRTE